MLPTLGFFLAAVLVLAGMLPFADWYMGLVVVSTIVLAMVYRNYSPRLSRAYWLGILTSVTAINLLVWSLWADIDLASQLLCYGILLALSLIAWYTRVGFLTLLSVSLPVCGLVQLWSASVTNVDSTPGMALCVWSLATWPFLALMSQGRMLLIAVLFGSSAIILVMYRLLAAYDLPEQIMWEIVYSSWEYSSLELTVIQCVLVVVSVGPLLINASSMWRWIAISGGLFIAGPLCMISLTGPWYDDWPVMIWYILYPSMTVCCIGAIGMLCTVHRPDLLGETAIRALSLGIGASAVLLLPFLISMPERVDLIQEFAPALAPLLCAGILSLVMACAALVAKRGEAPLITTESWERTRSRIAIQLKVRVSQFFKGFSKSMKEDSHRWLSPSSFVPFLICCSTYPVLHLLGEGGWISVCLIFIGFALARLWTHSIMIWAFSNAALCLLAALALGVDWPVAVSVLAPLILIFWLFLRWPSWDASWTYSAGFLCLCVIQTPVFLLNGQDPIPMLLACGVVVLLCNGLQDGLARWIILPVSSLVLMSYFSWWITRCDPFAMMMSNAPSQEWSSILYCVPVLLIILYVLMWSRQRKQASQHIFTASLPWQQHVLTVVALSSIVAWCFGWRPGVWSGIFAVLLMVLNAKSIYECLKSVRSDAIGWPLLDVLTLLLASLLIAGGDCYTYFLDNQRVTGTVQAGSLGAFVSTAERDFYACVFAVVIVFISMRMGLLVRTCNHVWQVPLALLKRLKRPAEDTEAADAASA